MKSEKENNKEEKLSQYETESESNGQKVPPQFKDNRDLSSKQVSLQKAANKDVIQKKTAQFNLITKGSEHGDKVNGAMAAVGGEVKEVIKRKKPSEMLSDISKLETSIQSRKAEQATFKDKSDPKYLSHQKRIDDEKLELGKLKTARADELASRPAKKKQPAKSEDGFTKVTRKKR